MSLFMKRAGLVAKLETTYGTDATPVGSANAMLVSNLNVSVLEGDVVERDFIRPWFGGNGSIRVSNYGKIDFEVELAGSGAAGTAPKWGPLMQACGFAETVTPATDVQYDPVSTGQKSLTLYYVVDAVRHVFLGARGTVSLDLSAKQIPKLKFSFTGLVGTITDNVIASADFSGFQTPATVSTANTTGLSIQGFTTAVMQTLSIDIANNVVYRQLVGAESVLITDRKPAGQLSIEATTVATKDWWSSIKSAAFGSFAIQHGQTAGNIVAITAPKVQLQSPKYSDSDGVAMFDASLAFVPVTGNDEIKITVK